MKSFIESVIRTGNYILAEMEERIQKMYVVGKLTAEEMAELLALAAENAKDQFQIDVTAKLKELEDRIFVLEHPAEPDYVVWYAGYVTKKGEVVKFDYNDDSILDLLRYDGGRSETSLRPGKIDGWHVVDADGNILGTYYNGEFIPVNAGDEEQTTDDGENTPVDNSGEDAPVTEGEENTPVNEEP